MWFLTLFFSSFLVTAPWDIYTFSISDLTQTHSLKTICRFIILKSLFLALISKPNFPHTPQSCAAFLICIFNRHLKFNIVKTELLFFYKKKSAPLRTLCPLILNLYYYIVLSYLNWKSRHRPSFLFSSPPRSM